LPGLAFPAPRQSFPTKDEMGDYLEQYAKHFKLPVRSGIKVDALCREGNFYSRESGRSSL
jgi:putative flavoprotein involved in K+ transport